MTDPADTVLSVRNVAYDYISGGLFGHRAAIRAVDDVSFDLRRKDVLAVIGESGCGKTTLSRILMSLLPPSRGEVRLLGKPLADWRRLDVARQMQIVFQDPYSSLNPRHSIGRIVARPLEIHGMGTAAERRWRAKEMLDVVGLPDRFLDNLPGHLSGGQRQRVVIARALILRPQVLICDEPTSALDVSVQAQILNLLLDLREQFGLSYVFISHNLAVVEHMATRVAIMYRGSVVEQGDPETIFRNPRHPYTRVLLRSVITPAPGAGIPESREVSDDERDTPIQGACGYYMRCGEALPACRAAPPPHVRDGDTTVDCHRYGAGRVIEMRRASGAGIPVSTLRTHDWSS